MRTIHIVLGVLLTLALAVPTLTPAANAGSGSCTTPGVNQPCQFECHLGDFIHVSASRTGFGSVHATAACGEASASCLQTGFDVSCSGSSPTPAVKTDIGTCITDTTQSVATCWVASTP